MAEVSFIPQVGGESCTLAVFISRSSCREGGLAAEPRWGLCLDLLPSGCVASDKSPNLPEPPREERAHSAPPCRLAFRT